MDSSFLSDFPLWRTFGCGVAVVFLAGLTVGIAVTFFLMR